LDSGDLRFWCWRHQLGWCTTGQYDCHDSDAAASSHGVRLAHHHTPRVISAQNTIRAEADRADALRQRVDELQAGQGLMMDTHAQALAEAQEQLERVREAAEDLRQAEVERRARGLVARLRQAWRGE
jgi:hypothetical protein